METKKPEKTPAQIFLAFKITFLRWKLIQHQKLKFHLVRYHHQHLFHHRQDLMG